MSKKNNSWADIYQKDIDKKGGMLPYFFGKIKKKKKLINLIKKYADTNIIECGSGTSVISIYLSTLGYKVIAVDVDRDVLNLSKKIASEYFNTLSHQENISIHFKEKSIFDLGFPKKSFDVAFSNGVLEHFSDAKIVEIIEQQLFIAKTTIIGVPTKYFASNEAKYGNERVLELSHWRTLIEIAGGNIIEEVGMDRQPWYKRLVNFRKYFKPKPYHLFVVKS